MKKIGYIVLILVIIIILVLLFLRINSIKIQEQPPIVVQLQPPIVVQEQPPIVVQEQPPIVVQAQPPIVVQEQPPVVIQEQPPVVIQEQPPVVIQEQPPVVVQEQPPIIVQEQPPITEEEPSIIICPEIEDKYYTFLPDAMLGEDILKGLSQFIKMFISPIREMFVPLVNFMSDTSKISATNNYIVGDINQTGLNAVSNANLTAKNGGTKCTVVLPSKIYFDLKPATQPVVDFCNLRYNDFYPSTKNVSINIGDNINQNIVSIAPNNVNTCIYDIMYNYNGNIPYGKSGRYIVIYFQGSRNESYLNLAELTAYDISGKIISLNKPVTMSSIYTGYPGSNLVDGKITTFSSTNNLCPWLYVDLGSDIPLSKIVLTNRQDCCQDRINGFRIGLVNSANFTTMLNSLKAPVNRSYPILSGFTVVSTAQYLNVVIPSSILVYDTFISPIQSVYTFNLS